jgi:hypothetical protein
VTIRTPFAEFEWSAKEADDGIVVTRVLRALRTRGGTIAPADYPAVRPFVQRVRAAGAAPIVLAPAPR